MKRKSTLTAILFVALAMMMGACVQPIATVEPETMVQDGGLTVQETAVDPEPLVTGLRGAMGSTVGPDGALYVTEGAIGRIARVDLETGEMTTLVEGLPAAVLEIGGVTDVAFIDETAYALVTLVGADLPAPVDSPGVVGIYRVDDSGSLTVITDIGQWSIDNPSQSDVFIPSGVHYAMDPFGDGLLVSDGHHNRLLYVTLDGEISERMAFDNIVPTGLAVAEDMVYIAEAGPSPHLPEDGKIVAFEAEAPTVAEIASGAQLLVDVEIDSDGTIYALSQGDFPEGADEGSPALPNTGSLVMVNRDSTFSVIAEGLDRPTSFEVIDDVAYVISLTGEVRKIDTIGSSP